MDNSYLSADIILPWFMCLAQLLFRLPSTYKHNKTTCRVVLKQVLMSCHALFQIRNDMTVRIHFWGLTIGGKN